MKRPKRQEYCNVHGYLIFEEKLIKAQEMYIDFLEKQTQKSNSISNVIILYCVMNDKDYWGNRQIHRMFTNRKDAELLRDKLNEEEYDDYVIEEIKTGE